MTAAVILAAFLLAAGTPPDAVPTTAPAVTLKAPAARVANCTEGDCHAAESRFDFQHGPVAVGACDTCHAYTDPAKHTFELKAKNQELCEFCHIGKTKVVGEVTHKPFADGDCLGCHSPHGASNPALVRAKQPGAVCANCHDVTANKSHLHGPVAAGDCSACHNAHKSTHPKLLLAEGRTLCLSCHDQMERQLSAAQHVHKPVQEDCMVCHDAHASNQVAQLKAEPVELCGSCHDDMRQRATSATVQHSVVTHDKACLNCHTPHGGNFAKLVKSRPDTLCMTCHDKPQENAAGRTVAAMAEISDPKLIKHGPIAQGNCNGCHEVHGGEVARLLTKPYPDTFYEPFDVESYTLCFSCHDQQLVLKEKTANLTRFRNGEQNLHFVHVNRAEKGRTCRACHSTHASKFPVHISESVPYGKWQMPIGYAATDSGGSCSPGCHKAVGYDRDEPQPGLKTPTPATPPSEAPKP